MSLERIKKIVELYNRHKQRKMSWKNFQHNCRTVKHRTDIARFRRIVENNGTFKCKAANVRSHVKAMFDNARSNHLPVHEVDLRRWAIDKAEELGLRFKACSTWILGFKRQCKISSRKVTRVVTSRINHSWESITSVAANFCLGAQRAMTGYSAAIIWNTD